MPWKECNAMDERLKFVARLLDGEKMAVMCREFGHSDKPTLSQRIMGVWLLAPASRRSFKSSPDVPSLEGWAFA